MFDCFPVPLDRIVEFSRLTGLALAPERFEFFVEAEEAGETPQVAEEPARAGGVIDESVVILALYGECLDPEALGASGTPARAKFVMKVTRRPWKSSPVLDGERGEGLRTGSPVSLTS